MSAGRYMSKRRDGVAGGEAPPVEPAVGPRMPLRGPLRTRLFVRPLVAALAVPLVLGFVACGGDDDDEATDAAAETTEAPADDSAVAGDVVATVFDSSVAFEDKVALIEDGEAHRADHEGYVAAAGQVGGITVQPTDVAADGDAATVTYRVLFAGTEAYADLSMDVTRVDGEWIVSTDAFCGFLASARTPCAGAGDAGGASSTDTTTGG